MSLSTKHDVKPWVGLSEICYRFHSPLGMRALRRVVGCKFSAPIRWIIAFGELSKVHHFVSTSEVTIQHKKEAGSPFEEMKHTVCNSCYNNMLNEILPNAVACQFIILHKLKLHSNRHQIDTYYSWRAQHLISSSTICQVSSILNNNVSILWNFELKTWFHCFSQSCVLGGCRCRSMLNTKSK